MKTFVIEWRHNHGWSTAVVNAESLEEAEQNPDIDIHAWPGYTVREISTKTPGLVHLTT